MLSIMKHKGKHICNECHSDLPKEETKGCGMRAIDWVPDKSKTTPCDYCGRDGYKSEGPMR